MVRLWLMNQCRGQSAISIIKSLFYIPSRRLPSRTPQAAKAPSPNLSSHAAQAALSYNSAIADRSPSPPFYFPDFPIVFAPFPRTFISLVNHKHHHNSPAPPTPLPPHLPCFASPPHPHPNPLQPPPLLRKHQPQTLPPPALARLGHRSTGRPLLSRTPTSLARRGRCCG